MYRFLLSIGITTGIAVEIIWLIFIYRIVVVAVNLLFQWKI